MKLTLVSIIIHSHRYSAFIMLEDGKHVSDQQLADAFPAYRCLRRGDTYSIG